VHRGAELIPSYIWWHATPIPNEPAFQELKALRKKVSEMETVLSESILENRMLKAAIETGIIGQRHAANRRCGERSKALALST